VAFLAEAIGTGILVFVIFSITNKKNSVMQGSGMVPPIIGLTVGSLFAVVAPLTQAGFNPGMSEELIQSLIVRFLPSLTPQRSTRLWTPHCCIFGWLGDGRVPGMVDLCRRTTDWSHCRGAGVRSIVCRPLETFVIFR
jgi:Major intrinsic protein